MSVVNYSAESGAKKSSNFVTSSRNEDTFQDNLQSIEEDRKQILNLRTMNSSRNKIL